MICSKHAIQEYLNDNPECVNPEKYLTTLFNKMRRVRAKGYKDFNTWTVILRYNDEAIVYNWETIITYYRIIALDLVKAKFWVIKEIEYILSKKFVKLQKKKEVKITKKMIRREKRERKQAVYTDAFTKCWSKIYRR